MNKIVFLSSTYTDLVEHRKMLWDLLESYDVKVKGMEKFGARREAPLDVCLQEVEESDIYIGIIGMRYGFVDEATGKSYTQLEYEKACELSKEIQIYIIDKEKAVIPVKDVDCKNYEKLEQFKSLILKHTVAFFTDQASLKEKFEIQFKNMLDQLNVSDFIELAQNIQKFSDSTNLYIKEKYNLDETPIIHDSKMAVDSFKFNQHFYSWYITELEKYDTQTLKRMLAIMYIGRGDDISLDTAYKNLKDWDKDKIVNQLTGKNPYWLIKYLEAGYTKLTGNKPFKDN